MMVPEPKHVAADFVYLIRFNNPEIYIIECISWRMKYLLKYETVVFLTIGPELIGLWLIMQSTTWIQFIVVTVCNVCFAKWKIFN